MTSNNTSSWDREGNAFERFVASPAGRVARVALGAGLIVIGLTVVEGPRGLVMATLGLVPLITGATNACPVAPLWGGHFNGARYCKPKG